VGEYIEEDHNDDNDDDDDDENVVRGMETNE